MSYASKLYAGWHAGRNLTDCAIFEGNPLGARPATMAFNGPSKQTAPTPKSCIRPSLARFGLFRISRLGGICRGKKPTWDYPYILTTNRELEHYNCGAMTSHRK
ncbi:MAG: hypothetical protein R3B47_14820 [Bacteroidia bacterium]